MTGCCEHCKLHDAGALADDFMVDWPDEPLMPRWLTATEDIWVTREGHVIPIVKIEDRHLYNIYRMLQRIEGQMDEIDEEGDLITPGPPIELFERKFNAIAEEMSRRQMPV